MLITIYVCIGTLQHANLRWTFGPVGRVIVSPAYHRLHHARDTQRVNLGVVLTIWDVLAGCARFPSRSDAVGRTGLDGRPVPVEQDDSAGLVRCFSPSSSSSHSRHEVATIRASTGRGPHVQPALAGFLTGYGRDFYVPGPLLAVGLALGVAGLAGIGRARRSGLRAPCLLFTIGVIAAVEPPFIIATFDWRYELPQLSLIPIAAVLGVMALASRASDRTPAKEPMSTDRLVHTGERADPRGLPDDQARP